MWTNSAAEAMRGAAIRDVYDGLQTGIQRNEPDLKNNSIHPLASWKR